MAAFTAVSDLAPPDERAAVTPARAPARTAFGHVRRRRLERVAALKEA